VKSERLSKTLTKQRDKERAKEISTGDEKMERDGEMEMEYGQLREK
tara:strand:- start:1571 stop:1708 length:138 start_codon:yes stop_codon:yes gene_type:complete